MLARGRLQLGAPHFRIGFHGILPLSLHIIPRFATRFRGGVDGFRVQRDQGVNLVLRVHLPVVHNLENFGQFRQDFKALLEPRGPRPSAARQRFRLRSQDFLVIDLSVLDRSGFGQLLGFDLRKLRIGS
jgi:hypothetical protein